MKKLLGLLILCNILIVSCEQKSFEFDRIIAKWQLVKGDDFMSGGEYLIDPKNQRIEEYTINNERILYDYLGRETGRANYTITDSNITVFGEELNGEEWKNDYEYWFKEDTLVVRHDGGFEYYDELFVQVD